MNISALLLCGAAVFGRVHSSIAFQPSRVKPTIYIYCPLKPQPYGFASLHCPWIGTRSARVSIQRKLPSFASCLEGVFDKVTCGPKGPRSSANSAGQDSLEMIINKHSGELDSIRDAFWNVLFRREGNANPPTSAEVDEVYEMYQEFLRKNPLGWLVGSAKYGPTLEYYMAEFVFPEVEGSSEQTTCVQYLGPQHKFTRKAMDELIAGLKLIELAVVADISYLRLHYASFGLIVSCGFNFATSEEKTLFKSLLFEAPSPEMKAKFEAVVPLLSRWFYRECYGEPWIGIYHRLTDADGPIGWTSVGHLNVPCIINKNKKLCPPILEIVVRLWRAASDFADEETRQRIQDSLSKLGALGQ